MVIIPARYESSRFPGKPLCDIAGKPMVVRVWERCREVETDVVVATDDTKIASVCHEHGVPTILAGLGGCDTGTDRVADAAVAFDADVIINVQGDEPLVDPAAIEAVRDFPSLNVVNAMTPILNREQFESRNVPKMAVSNGRLMYASRSPIPGSKDGRMLNAMKQVCIYKYPRWALQRFREQGRTWLEAVEDIEILRFVEMGIPVHMVQVEGSLIAVDTPEDAKAVNDYLRRTAA